MDAKGFTGEPGALFSDRDWDRRDRRDPNIPICRRCRKPVSEGAVSTPTGTYCRQHWREREEKAEAAA